MADAELRVVDDSARERVLSLITADGPITASELAERLGVTPVAVRRHIAQLECDGLVAVFEPPKLTRGRGRPARHYVTTGEGQSELSGAYAEIAAEAMRFLRETAGQDGIEQFARRRVAEQRRRYARTITADDVAERARELATALTDDGYAATVRPVAGAIALQLCQGHCPVQQIAEEFPQLCETEAEAFSALLGSHVQRLSTIAGGGHACTTNIPVSSRRAAPGQDSAATKVPSEEKETR